MSHSSQSGNLDGNAQRFYSRLASLYDLGLWLNGYKRAVCFLAEQLPFHTGEPLTILDAGCGTGLYSIALLKRFPKASLLAVDLNAAMLAQLKESLRRRSMDQRARVAVANVLGEIAGGDRPVDLIVAGGVMEYVDIRQAVQNLARYLRAGGHFLNAPVRDNLPGVLVGRWMGFKPHPARENLAAFTEGGFDLLQTWRLSCRFFPISLIKEAHLFRKQSPVN
jgi:SAM-dependent methyltransferase